MTIKPMSEITEAEFLAYRRVQESGVYNMVMDARAAIKASGLDPSTYWSIISNYTSLYNKFI